MTKYTIHVPTIQYGFIEAEMEGDSKKAIMAHNELLNLATGQIEGLETKEWNNTIDLYLTDNAMDSSVHERMSLQQSWMIHEIDKSFERITRRNLKK